jgi:hypothetical protein
MERIKRVTFDIPADMHLRIKIRCARQDIPMRGVLRTLLEQAFAQQDRQRAPARAKPKPNAEAV